MRAEATVGEALRAVRAALREGGIPEAESDARCLAAFALGLDTAGFILRERDPVGVEGAARLDALLQRRLGGEPVGRIIGRRAFFEHEFQLSPDTLEPRADTEALVQLASRALARMRPDAWFADVGTGTGILAVSLLALHGATRCVATDLAEGALAIAGINAREAGVGERFMALRGDFLDALGTGSLDLVVSNPPYIPSMEIAGLSREVREHDPLLALDGGPEGLDAFRRIMEGALRVLRPGGALLFEIGRGQEAAVEAIGRPLGFQLLEVAQDLGGVLRALHFGRVPPESHRS